jgi:hypothetical protein
MSTVNNGPQIVRSGLVLGLDASNMRSYSPNVMPNPTDIFAWAINGGSTSCTITRDSSQTRQYGSTPMKMAVTGNDPYIITINYGPGASSIWNLAPAANGQTWTISVYVKASVATTGELFLMPADSNGVVITSASGAVSITTSWTRVSFTYTISSATTAFIQCRLDGPNSGGSGINIWWDGLQVERASAATTFNPYYFGDTVWKDVSGNGRNGTLTSGPTFDISNKGSIVFNGSTQYVTTSNIALSFTTFSMECLVKYTSLSGNQGLFTYNNTNVINLWKGSGLGMRWEVNTSNQSITGANDLATGVWYHFVGVYNGSQGILYRNGIVYAGPTTLTSHTSEAANFEIGRYNGAGNTNGNIAIARFYTRALTATEVVQNYETTKTRFGL